MISKYVILFNFFVLTLAMPLMAQDMEGDVLPPVAVEALPEAELLPDVKFQKQTHPEKILFTQLKLSKMMPDVDTFAKVSPFVAQAQEIDKQAMVLSEYNRIANAYSLHNEKEQIVVHVDLKTDEYSSLQNLMVFDEFDDKTFFKFKMYNEFVGIVPEDAQKYSRIQLSKASAERLFKAISGGNKIVAEFILKPVYADRREPFVMNDNEFWMMFARVSEFRLWSNDNPDKAELLWFHRSDWYSPNDKAGIGGLYVKE